MKYTKFVISNYRAIKGPLEIDISKFGLVPLIGANECGKTSILQGIFSFDYTNDKEYEGRHLKEIRNLYEPQNTNMPKIVAYISGKKEEVINCLDEKLRIKYVDIDNFTNFTITRTLDGNMEYTISVINDKVDSNLIAREVVQRMPYIIYNDDFIERPQNLIDIPKNNTELTGWVGIYERAFNKAKSSIFERIEEPDENIRLGIISDVEDEINNTLVKEWSRISLDDGNCLSIKLDIKGNQNTYKLQVKIKEKYGTRDRYFDIEERSKGFLWFFNFVMKIKYNPKASGTSDDIIYLLDEPGSYLHTVAQ